MPILINNNRADAPPITLTYSYEQVVNSCHQASFLEKRHTYSSFDCMDNGFHERQMRVALRQAEKAFEEGEVPTGCVIIDMLPTKSGGMARIIGSAHNQTELLKDPTAHAEMIAITQAASARGDWRLTDTILYVTKEPCAMCAGAIVLARIPLVVFGVPDPKRGGAVSVFNILDHEQLNHRADVISGVMEEECRAILQSFFRARRAKNILN
jgi:tRNA(adenine34) deaminase